MRGMQSDEKPLPYVSGTAIDSRVSAYSHHGHTSAHRIWTPYIGSDGQSLELPLSRPKSGDEAFQSAGLLILSKKFCHV